MRRCTARRNAPAAKNRALAFLLKSYGMLDDGVEEVLDCYFRACSIRVNSRDLAISALPWPTTGKALQSDEPLFPARYARYVNAIMLTCGMYDGSGDFAIRVGLPAKSGVGGGIMAVVPTRMGIGSSHPAWTEKGTAWPAFRCWSACPGGCI